MRAAVHRAVEELVAESPSADLTMPTIAARAGVHPTTVYRRWGSLADLLAEVATSRFSGDIVVPDTGTLEGDLERWTADVAVDLLTGQTPKADTTLFDTPTKLFVPVVVTAQNLKAEIIDKQVNGKPIETADVLCTGAYADGCKKLGITP